MFKVYRCAAKKCFMATDHEGFRERSPEGAEAWVEQPVTAQSYQEACQKAAILAAREEEEGWSWVGAQQT